jgi:hypothetical protein
MLVIVDQRWCANGWSIDYLGHHILPISHAVLCHPVSDESLVNVSLVNALDRSSVLRMKIPS